MSFLALLAGFGSPDLFSTSCHGKTMVATGRPVDAGWESMVHLLVLPGCGCPHLSRRVRKTPSMRIYLFPSLGLTNFGVLGVCSIERWRANRGSFTSVSADAVITSLFMPCVPRFIITSPKLTCTFSLCENSEHKRFF